MSIRSDEKRMLLNEVYFRSLNLKVQQGIDEVNKVAEQEGEAAIDIDGDKHLHFLCECADENCVERISISLNKYNEIHKDPKTFVVMHNHQVHTIEDVLAEEPEYTVVRKHEMPPQTASKLHATSIDNQE